MSSIWGSIVSDYERSANVKINEVREKACSRCKEIKLTNEFYPRISRGMNSYTSLCRPCMKDYNKELRLKKKKKGV